MKIRDWYFQGWERRDDGSGKSRLVYTGEYYRFPGGIRKVRRPALILMAALLALYLAAALNPSAGGMWQYAAVPQLLELIPLIYLVIGAACLLRAKEPLTFRDHYASWRRMGKASLWSLIFTVLMAAAEIAYLILFPADGTRTRELLFLLEEIGCAALSAALYGFIQKNPCASSVDGAPKE